MISEEGGVIMLDLTSCMGLARDVVEGGGGGHFDLATFSITPLSDASRKHCCIAACGRK